MLAILDAGITFFLDCLMAGVNSKHIIKLYTSWYNKCLVRCIMMQLTPLISCCSACRLPRWPQSSLCFPVRTQIKVTMKYLSSQFYIFHSSASRCGFRWCWPCSGGPPRCWGQRSARSPWLYKQHKSCPGVGHDHQASRSPAPELCSKESDPVHWLKKYKDITMVIRQLFRCKYFYLWVKSGDVMSLLW